jgi:hypothetical protein
VQALLFAAASVCVLPEQMMRLLDIGAMDALSLLDSLVDKSLLSRTRVFPVRPACYMSTAAGLAEVGCSLPVPSLDLAHFRRDVALAWLWLQARDGELGRDMSPLSYREQLVRFGRADADLRLVWLERWVPVNVLYAPPDLGHWEVQLRRYVSDPAMYKALFFVEDRERVGDQIIALAERLGLKESVSVQFLNA